MASRRAALDVHEFEGRFRGAPAFFKMTSVIGHVFSIDFPPAYNNWDKVDPGQLYDAKTLKGESNPKVGFWRLGYLGTRVGTHHGIRGDLWMGSLGRGGMG